MKNVEKADLVLAKLRESLGKMNCFPREGRKPNLIGPSVTWLGTSTFSNYLGSPKSDPFDVAVTTAYPSFGTDKIYESLGKLLRRKYKQYILPILSRNVGREGGREEGEERSRDKRSSQFPLDIWTDGEGAGGAEHVVDMLFSSFEHCRKYLKKGKLDNFIKSMMQNCRNDLRDESFGAYLLLWDACHADNPPMREFFDVPLFHDSTFIEKDKQRDVLFEISALHELDEGDESLLPEHVLKKAVRKCVMDAYNIMLHPYERVRCHIVVDELIDESDVKTVIVEDFVNQDGEEDVRIARHSVEESSSAEKRKGATPRAHVLPLARRYAPQCSHEDFGMGKEEYETYMKKQRKKIVSMPLFSILQTLVCRIIFIEKTLALLPREYIKSKLGLYLCCWQDTMSDLMFQLVSASTCVEELTDVYLKHSGAYTALYPHKKRFFNAGDLPDATGLILRSSIWTKHQGTKNDKVSDFHHMILEKQLPHKCKGRNETIMLLAYTLDMPLASKLIIDEIVLTLLGLYPHAAFRPSMVTRVLVRQMGMGFATKSHIYFLEWVRKNKNLVFFSLKEYLFYQLTFLTPLQNIVYDTTMFEEHEESIIEYLDSCRKIIDGFVRENCINYFQGYEPDFIKRHPDTKRSQQRVVKIQLANKRPPTGKYPEEERGRDPRVSCDVEMMFSCTYKPPKSKYPSFAKSFFGTDPSNRQYTFLHPLVTGIERVMAQFNYNGADCHTGQKHFFRKLVKKPFQEQLLSFCKSVDKVSVTNKEKRRSFFEAKIGMWTEALIIVHLEKQIKNGEVILNDNPKEWTEFDPGTFGKLRRAKQLQKAAVSAAFKRIVQVRRQQEMATRRPRIIDQAVNDYLAELNVEKHSVNKESGSPMADQLETMVSERDSKRAIMHAETIRKAAWTARKRKDGWFDFVTWMRVIGISRFGRQWLKCVYFQYTKAAIPDNRFATFIEILMCLRPRDFQIIREFCFSYINAPTIRVIHMGPSVAINQLYALRKRYRLEFVKKTPEGLGTSYFCPTCGLWADVEYTKDSKHFKLFGIGLDSGVYDCISGKLYCEKQGSLSCSSDRQLRVVNTIGVAVSVCSGPFKVRCASCGILTDLHEANFDERGPTCKAHLAPDDIVKIRPINSFTKTKLTTLGEVEAIDHLRAVRLFNGLEERREKPKCYYCSKIITVKPAKLKTIHLLYDPNPNDSLCAAFRYWKSQSVGTTPGGACKIIKVILCEKCHKTCRGWLHRIGGVPTCSDFTSFMKQQWQSANIRRQAKSGPFTPHEHIMKMATSALYS